MICDAKNTNFFFEITFTYTFFFEGNVKEYYYNIIKNTTLYSSCQFKPITLKLIALHTIYSYIYSYIENDFWINYQALARCY